MALQQVIHVGGRVSVYFPPWVQRTYDALSLLLFDFNFIRPGCTIGAVSTSTVYSWYLMATTCMAVFFVILAFIRSFVLFKRSSIVARAFSPLSEHDLRKVYSAPTVAARIITNMSLHDAILDRLQHLEDKHKHMQTPTTTATFAATDNVTTIIDYDHHRHHHHDDGSMTVDQHTQQHDDISVYVKTNPTTSNSPSSKLVRLQMFLWGLLVGSDSVPQIRASLVNFSWKHIAIYRALHSLTILVGVLFFTLTYRSFQMLYCKHVDMDDGDAAAVDGGDGSYYDGPLSLRLVVELSRVCYQGEHARLVPWAWIMLLALVILFPILGGISVYRVSRHGFTSSMRLKFGFFFRGLRSSALFYSLVPFVINIFTALQAGFNLDSEVEVLVSGLFFVVNWMLVCFFWPYQKIYLNIITALASLGRVVYFIILINSIRASNPTKSISAFLFTLIGVTCACVVVGCVVVGVRQYRAHRLGNTRGTLIHMDTLIKYNAKGGSNHHHQGHQGHHVPSSQSVEQLTAHDQISLEIANDDDE
eukprot:TRINITY_DN11394_c0_g1_i1.p1 TRINITY_DN11394_c0_g1~~TRINITY_DN11394_c0_g1_i1.p1  ORF type:complete len:531 (+),score=84.79 TRINITY_DN11394_c0_g1_i1:91-1683(+)